jgi:hypothetical protein
MGFNGRSLMDFRVVMGYVANSMILGVSKQWAKYCKPIFVCHLLGNMMMIKKWISGYTIFRQTNIYVDEGYGYIGYFTRKPGICGEHHRHNWECN